MVILGIDSSAVSASAAVVKDGKLIWKSAPFKAAPDGESGNFNPDWFEGLLPEEPKDEIDRESAN